jgi:hypothetical protein
MITNVWEAKPNKRQRVFIYWGIKQYAYDDDEDDREKRLCGKDIHTLA